MTGFCTLSYNWILKSVDHRLLEGVRPGTGTTIKPGFHWRISISIRRGAHAEWYQDDGRSIRHITFDMFAWGLGQSHLSLVHGLLLMLVQYVDPVFTSQSYDISITTNTRRTNFTMSVFLVDPVFTCLHMCLCLCLWLCLCASENQPLGPDGCQAS